MKNFITILFACLILWWFFWYEPKKKVQPKAAVDSQTNNDSDATADTPIIGEIQNKIATKKCVRKVIGDNVLNPDDTFVYFVKELNNDLSNQNTNLTEHYCPSAFLQQTFVIQQQGDKYYVEGFVVFDDTNNMEQAQALGAVCNQSDPCQANVLIPLTYFDRFIKLKIDYLEIYLYENL